MQVKNCRKTSEDVRTLQIKGVQNQEASYDVQAAKNFVEKWTNTWELPLSVEKSHYLVIQSKSKSHLPTYTLYGSVSEQLSSARDLGFHFSRNLNFEQHFKARIGPTCCPPSGPFLYPRIDFP